MRAMLLKKQAALSDKSLELAEIERPSPAPGELLVEVKTCGVCRTDLHVIEGDLPAMLLPLIPGHQVVGKVAALGVNCKRFKTGDRVGVAWLRHTCQDCEYCLRDSENLCPDSLYTGYHAHGGYAEYAIVHEDYAYAIPQSIDDIQAAPLLCAGIIGYRALKRSRLPKGGKLGIIGFGSSAHLTLQVALRQAGEIYVATRDLRHQQMAKRMGASWVGAATAPLPSPVDSVIIFAPAGELVPLALKSLKKGGTVSLAGIHMSDIPAMKYAECLFNEKNLCSVEANTRLDGEEFLREAEASKIKAHVQTWPLEQANQVLLKLKHDGIEGTAVLTT